MTRTFENSCTSCCVLHCEAHNQRVSQHTSSNYLSIPKRDSMESGCGGGGGMGGGGGTSHNTHTHTHTHTHTEWKVNKSLGVLRPVDQYTQRKCYCSDDSHSKWEDTTSCSAWTIPIETAVLGLLFKTVNSHTHTHTHTISHQMHRALFEVRKTQKKDPESNFRPQTLTPISKSYVYIACIFFIQLCRSYLFEIQFRSVKIFWNCEAQMDHHQAKTGRSCQGSLWERNHVKRFWQKQNVYSISPA